jgi:rRNA maturation endonuclease Nob1
MWNDAITDGLLMTETNVKICAACGRKVAADAHFCAWCGADLSANEEQNVQQDSVTEEAVVGWASGMVKR